MYVIKPSPQPRPSYSACAADMVRPAPNPSLELASCCIVDVVNGGLGLRAISFSETSATENPPPSFAESTSSAAVSASAKHARSIFPSFVPCTCVSSATNKSPESPELPGLRRSHAMVQNSCFVNFSISNSRSQINRSATLCTLPALSRCALGIFRQSTPESENPKR